MSTLILLWKIISSCSSSGGGGSISISSISSKQL